MIHDGVPMIVDGQRRWVEYSHVDFDESDFVALGDAYTAAGGTETRAPLGAGEVRRLPMRELVAFAVGWIAEHRLQRR
jgi:aminoglycoside 3-N-acetyltransferase